MTSLEVEAEESNLRIQKSRDIPVFSSDDVSSRQLQALGISMDKDSLLVLNFGSGESVEKTGLPLFDMYAGTDEYNRDLMEAVWIDVFSVGGGLPMMPSSCFRLQNKRG